MLRTVLLCDLVDSTALVERLGDTRTTLVFQRHDRLILELLEATQGRLIDKADGLLALFERPIQAVDFALRYQRGLRVMGVELGLPLQARVGIHVGDVMTWKNDPHAVSVGAKPMEVEGLAKPVAARLMALAQPSQILMSGMAQSLAQRAIAELGETAEKVRWMVHGRYRFKGVPAPMIVHEVGEPGYASLRQPQSGQKGWREIPLWRRPPMLALEVLVVMAVAAVSLWTTLKSEPALAFSERDWVVVGDLQNHTPEKLFDQSLDSAFRVGLEQSRYVNLVSELQVREGLSRMQRQGQSVDRQIGAELALREGAKALVLATIGEVGGRIRFSVEIIDPNTGVTVHSVSADSNNRDGVIPAMDEVLAGLRERLGESLASIGKTSVPLKQITTANLEALKLYGSAEELIGKGQINEGRFLIEQALKLDPGFAMAWSRLATIQYSVDQNPGAAVASFNDAMKHRERLSGRELLILEATVSTLTRDLRSTLTAWSATVQTYPDFAGAQHNLAFAQMWLARDPKAAIPHLDVVTRSKHPLRGYSAMLRGLARLQLGDTAAASIDMDEGLTLVRVAPNYEYVLPKLAAGEHEKLLQLLGQEPSNLPPSFRAEWWLRRAAVEVDRGDLSATAVALDNAARIAAVPGASPTQRAKIRLAQTALMIARGRPAGRKQLFDFVREESARRNAPGGAYDLGLQLHLAHAASMAARIGETQLARIALSAAAVDPRILSYVPVSKQRATADCEIKHAEAASARLNCLDSLVDGKEPYQAHVAMRSAAMDAKDTARAARELAWLQQHRGIAVVETENQTLQIPNLLDLNATR